MALAEHSNPAPTDTPKPAGRRDDPQHCGCRLRAKALVRARFHPPPNALLPLRRAKHTRRVHGSPAAQRRKPPFLLLSWLRTERIRRSHAGAPSSEVRGRRCGSGGSQEGFRPRPTSLLTQRSPQTALLGFGGKTQSQPGPGLLRSRSGNGRSCCSALTASISPAPRIH